MKDEINKLGEYDTWDYGEELKEIEIDSNKVSLDEYDEVIEDFDQKESNDEMNVDPDNDRYDVTESDKDTIKQKAIAKAERNKKIKSTMTELLLYVLVALICLLVVPRYVIQRTIVSGASMENTLMSGDNLLVEKVSYRFDQPTRFDVVVFYPYGKDEKEYYVKRVIGLPGETIQIIGEDIYINGKVLDEDYGKNPITYQGIAKDPITLGEDEYFLMGDNREVSFDSRYQEVGPVHADLIAGRAILRIWPLNQIGTFE